MKRLLKCFWKRNLGFFNLAVVSNLEYRINYFVDAIVQPTIGSGIEFVLWFAVFESYQQATLAGHSRASYLAYAIWAPFISRISTNWMYERKMMEEIELGTINTSLARPYSFFEYYLFQLLGYKIVTTVVSIWVPIFICWYFELPIAFEMIPVALLVLGLYLVLVHAISFVVSNLAFFFNNASGFSFAKNIILWLATGEIVPLDLLPDGIRQIVVALPFAGGVFGPVGLITGRVGLVYIGQTVVSILIGICVFTGIGLWMWHKGRLRYAGTGA